MDPVPRIALQTRSYPTGRSSASRPPSAAGRPNLRQFRGRQLFRPRAWPFDAADPEVDSVGGDLRFGSLSAFRTRGACFVLNLQDGEVAGNNIAIWRWWMWLLGSDQA